MLSRQRGEEHNGSLKSVAAKNRCQRSPETFTECLTVSVPSSSRHCQSLPSQECRREYNNNAVMSGTAKNRCQSCPETFPEVSPTVSVPGSSVGYKDPFTPLASRDCLRSVFYDTNTSNDFLQSTIVGLSEGNSDDNSKEMVTSTNTASLNLSLKSNCSSLLNVFNDIPANADQR